MSSPGLADPQLSAFFAADPSVLPAPDPIAGYAQPTVEQYTPKPHERPALELAAAFLVVAGLVARHLAHREPDARPEEAAKSAWQAYAPVWLRLTVPAIRHAYALGKVTGLGGAELEAMATDYATELGEYVNQSSADALAAGFGQQLNAKWSEKVAWQRAAAGYGLDRAAMHAHIAGLMRGGEVGQTDVMPKLSRVFVDKLLMRRADRLGQTEAWRARQSGKVISWLYLQRQGRLPAVARKQWKTREDETTCPICAPLDDVIVALDQPWVTGEGVRLWAPSAHPGCRCEAELVIPDVDVSALAKAYDPREARDVQGRWAKQPAAPRRPARVAERQPVKNLLDDLPVEAAAPDEAPATKAPAAPANPFGEVTVDDPFGAAPNPLAANPFGAAANPFGTPTNPFGETKRRNPFAGEEEPGKAALRRRQIIRRITEHHIIVPKKPEEERGPRNPDGQWHMAYSDIATYFEEGDGFNGSAVDFDKADEFLRYRGLEHGDEAFGGLHAFQYPHAWDARTERPEWIDPTSWDKVNEAAVPAWWHAIENADDIVDGDDNEEADPPLDDEDIHAIAKLIGLSHDAYDVGAARTQIVKEAHKIRDLGDTDSGDVRWGKDRQGPTEWAEAYADYVTFLQPYRLGDPGRGMLDAYAETDASKVEGADNEYNAFEHLALDPEKVFTFADVHSSQRNDARGHAVDVHRDYWVDDMIYRSAIADLGAKAPVGAIGMMQYILQPDDLTGAGNGGYGDPLLDDEDDLDEDGDYIDPFDDR